MSMWMTPIDVATFVTQLVAHVASRLRIPDFELKSAAELMEEVREKDVAVSEALLEFVLAYEEWYAVHELIERAGRSESRLQLLVDRVLARDAKREALKSALTKYP